MRFDAPSKSFSCWNVIYPSRSMTFPTGGTAAKYDSTRLERLLSACLVLASHVEGAFLLQLLALTAGGDQVRTWG